MKSNFVSCKKHARLKQALVCTATLAGFILFTGPTFSAHADTNSTPTNTQNSGATTDNGTAVLKNNVTNSDSVHTGDVANDDVSSDTNSPTDNSGNDTDNGNSSTHGTTETATTDSDSSGQQAADATDQSTTSTTASGPVATTDSHNQSLNDPLTSKEMYYYEPTNDPTESPWSTAIPFHYLNDPNDPTKALPYDDPGYDNTYFYPTAKGWKGYVYYYTDNSERGAALEKAGWYPLTTYVDNDPTKGYKMPQFEDPKNLTTNTYLTILPDAQQATINFVDTDNNRLLHQVIAWNGKTSSISTYDPQIAINGYLAQGYELVSNDFVKNFKYDNIDDGQGVVSQTFTIALKSSATTESKTITRIINYLDQQTQVTVANSINQSVTFTRTSTTNGLTGEKNYTPWMPEGDTFAEVSSPDLTAKGYLAPDKPVVESLKVTPDINNIVVNVYYSKATTTTPGNPGEPTQPATPPTEPGKPTSPTNPVVPEIPENPVTPDTPENSQPETPQTENNQTTTSQTGAKVENNVVATAEKNVPVAKSDYNQAMAATSTITTLPQTSESSQSKTSLLGLIGLALAGFLGFDLNRRHN